MPQNIKKARKKNIPNKKTQLKQKPVTQRNITPTRCSTEMKENAYIH